MSSVKHGSSAHNGLRPLTLAVGRGQACARSTPVLARDHRADFVCWPECSRGCLCRLPSITRFLVVGQTSPLTLHNVIPSICASFALIAAINAVPCIFQIIHIFFRVTCLNSRQAPRLQSLAAAFKSLFPSSSSHHETWDSRAYQRTKPPSIDSRSRTVV